MKLDKILLENNKYLIQNYQRFPIEMIKGMGLQREEEFRFYFWYSRKQLGT